MGNLFTYNTGEYIMQMFLIKKGKEYRRIISAVRAFLSFLIDIPQSVKKIEGSIAKDSSSYYSRMTVCTIMVFS
jgi:hypothetical protein